jgi:hypothetical protein
MSPSEAPALATPRTLNDKGAITLAQKTQTDAAAKKKPAEKPKETGTPVGSGDEKSGTSSGPADHQGTPLQSKALPGQGEVPDSSAASKKDDSGQLQKKLDTDSAASGQPKQDDPQPPKPHPSALPAGQSHETHPDEPSNRQPSPGPVAKPPTSPTVVTKECPAAPAGYASSAESGGSGPSIALAPQAVVLVPLLIVVALLFGYLLARYLARRERNKLTDAQRAIGEALREPRISLSDVPTEIRSMENQMSGFHAKNIVLEEKIKDLEQRLKRQELGPDARRAAALSDCLDDAASSVESLAAGDADFGVVAEVLDLASGLRRSATALRNLPDDASFRTEVDHLLERGDLDSSLTASAILEKYFSERFSWREVRVSVKAADALLVSLLESIGNQIVDVPILSVVGRHDIRDMAVSDRRNLRSIPAIQQRAARIARELQSNEMLVVDWHKPGWISDRLGTRSPALAIFDPASWT